MQMTKITVIIAAICILGASLGDNWQFHSPVRGSPALTTRPLREGHDSSHGVTHGEAAAHGEYLMRDGKWEPDHAYILAAGQSPDRKTYLAALKVSCEAMSGGFKCK
jgi:hypothetical protein